MPLYRGLYLHFTCTIAYLLHNLFCHQKVEFTISYLIVYPYCGHPVQIFLLDILFSS